MATDARIAVGLPQHPKTKKLIKRLGQAAAWNLVCLFLWAATNRSDGDLSGMSAEDIELACDWQGEDGAFVKALVDVRFIDAEGDGSFVLHDWQEHNPWAAGADMRSAKARWNAAKRHHGIAEANRLVPEYAAIRNASSNASSKPQAEDKQASGNAPSPSPSPSHYSVPNGTDAGASALPVDSSPPTDRELIFANGVPLLTVAGVTEKNARSMLAGLCKRNGDAAVAKALDDCAKARPVEPVSWLQAALTNKPAPSKQQSLEDRNRAVAEAWVPPELRAQQAQGVV